MKRLFVSVFIAGSLFGLTGCQSTVNNSGIYATEGSTVNITIQQEEITNTETFAQMPQQEEHNEYIQQAIAEEKAILASYNNMAILRCEQPHAKAGKQYEILDVVYNKNNLRYVFRDDFGQIAEINKVNFELPETTYSYNYDEPAIEEDSTPEVSEEPTTNDNGSEAQKEYNDDSYEESNLEEWGVHTNKKAPDGYRFIAEGNKYHHSRTSCNHINDGRDTKLIPEIEAYSTRITCKHC